MKKLTVLFVLVALFAAPVLSQTLETVSKESPKYSVVEDNLLHGLENGNLGLKADCAYWLGEMKSQKAVVSLMKVFRSDDDQRAQLMAALSLMKIEDGRGVYIVKRVAEFTDNERMQRVCNQLYTGYLNKQQQGKVEVQDIYRATLDQAEQFVAANLK